MEKVASSALDLIGNTPLVQLSNLVPREAGRLFAKVEFVQPGGSVKDRAALKILQLAEAKGDLKAGMPVVEMTSGNMGAGLAVVCAVKRHPFIAVMSEGNSPERAKMLRGLGAEVILTPQVTGAPGQVTGEDIARATEVAKELARERGAYYVDQFNNPGSTLAHEESTGPEIWQQVGSKLDAFVAAVGSGGTFVGTSRFLKAKNPGVRCFAVEPEGSQVLAGKKISQSKHLLQGIGYGAIPPHWDSSVCDGFLSVSDNETLNFRKMLAEKEGLFVGFSAAANVAASVALLKSGKLGSNARVVTVLCDTGLKY